MKTDEKLALATARVQHNQLKRNKVVYGENRDLLIRAILKAPIPNWGNAKVTVTKNGI